jgi:hypothetical protein
MAWTCTLFLFSGPLVRQRIAKDEGAEPVQQVLHSHTQAQEPITQAQCTPQCRSAAGVRTRTDHAKALHTAHPNAEVRQACESSSNQQTLSKLQLNRTSHVGNARYPKPRKLLYTNTHTRTHTRIHTHTHAHAQMRMHKWACDVDARSNKADTHTHINSHMRAYTHMHA